MRNNKSSGTLFAIVCLGIWNGITSGFAQTPEKTKNDTNREVVRTYAKLYNESGEYEKADHMLWDYLTTEGEDQSLWILLGQVQLSEKKFTQSCYAFQKASTLAKDPKEKAYADYSLADCLNQGARQADAKTILRKLVYDEADFSDSAQDTLNLINSDLLKSGIPFPLYQIRPPSRLRVSAALGSGFDTNVLLIEDALISGTPVASRGSFFLTPGLQVGYSGYALKRDFETRYMATFTDYTNLTAKSFNSFYQRADLVIGKGEFKYGLFADTYFLNKTTGFTIYDWEAGVMASKILQVRSDRVIMIEAPLQYQKYIKDATITEINDRTGADLKVKTTVRFPRGDIEMITAQLTLDGQYTIGQNYRQFGVDLPFSWIKPLPYLQDYGITNMFSLGATFADYFQADTGRKDLAARVGAGIMKSISGFNGSLDYSYMKNLSNVPSARYSKGIISLQISRELY